jgi:hypothetical protein
MEVRIRLVVVVVEEIFEFGEGLPKIHASSFLATSKIFPKISLLLSMIIYIGAGGTLHRCERRSPGHFLVRTLSSDAHYYLKVR